MFFLPSQSATKFKILNEGCVHYILLETEMKNISQFYAEDVYKRVYNAPTAMVDLFIQKP